APAVPLLRLFDLPIPSDIGVPEFCRTTLVDLVVEGRASASGFYVNCYDSALRNSRTTLYRALEGETETEQPARVTVEVMEPPSAASEDIISPEEVLVELQVMGIFPANTRL